LTYTYIEDNTAVPVILRYNLIPDSLLVEDISILDIGCGSGSGAISSRHNEFFLRASLGGRYVGIDVYPPDKTFLNVIKKDILDTSVLEFDQFDLVIALHLVEHIEFTDWPVMFRNVKELVRPGGHVFLAMPYKEKPIRYGHYRDDAHRHKVFGITPELMYDFLPGATFEVSKERGPSFWEDGASFSWAFMRYFKRRLLRHPLAYPLFNLSITWSKISDTVKGNNSLSENY
jgi:SAM-dependent methyltransferase